jgi:hypothetical protein
MCDDGAADEWDDYDSGPFCAHWQDYDCDKPCGSCGHRCHSLEGSCYDESCDCAECTDNEPERTDPPTA